MNQFNDRFDLKDKVIIVTGAAQGIGKAIAIKLVASGAKVVISDVQEEKCKATAAEIGASAIFIPCDISSHQQVCKLVGQSVDQLGRIDVMVNNAGINSGREEDRVTVDKYPVDLWHKMINIDLSGTFYCCQEAAKVMVRQKSGSIVNIASIAGVVALRLQIGFVAAKAAIIKMTEAMACELGPMGIRVNTVSPGSTLTEGTRKLYYGDDAIFRKKAEKVVSFIPQGRPGEACEIADAVAFLASNSASYITGQNIIVDGGWTCGFNRDF